MSLNNKGLFFILILLIMMVELNCGSMLYAEENYGDDTFERVLTVPWGNGAGYLIDPKDTTGPPDFFPIPVGPSGFWVDDKRIYIVDAYKKKVVVFKDGQYEKSLNVNSKEMPVDLVVWRSNIIVLDGTNLIRLGDQGVGGYIKKVSGLFETLQPWRIALLGNKLMLSSDQYAGSIPSTFAVSGRVKCFSADTFREASCVELTGLYQRNEILDVDDNNYLYFNAREGVLGVAPYDSRKNVVLTQIRTDDYYEPIKYEIGNIFRLKGDFIYILRPEKDGVSILRYKWRF